MSCTLTLTLKVRPNESVFSFENILSFGLAFFPHSIRSKDGWYNWLHFRTEVMFRKRRRASSKWESEALLCGS